MGKKILLIQPHSDDIAFSSMDFLFKRGKKDTIEILTVEIDEKRLKEDIKFCEEFNAKLITCKTNICTNTWYKDFYSQNKEVNFENSNDFCKSEVSKEDRKALKKELKEICKDYKNRGYTIVTCLGLGHPFHYLVQKYTFKFADFFYRDFPHSYKRRALKFMKIIEENEIFELGFEGDITHHDAKFDSIKRNYKSQSSLLFFEQNYIKKKLKEEFYVKIK